MVYSIEIKKASQDDKKYDLLNATKIAAYYGFSFIAVVNDIKAYRK